jgi:hypothetical protein
MISSTAASADARSVTAISCGQPSSSGGGLGARGADEHGPLPAAGGQAAQPLGDAPVQVPDGRELLAAGQRLTGLHRLARRPGRNKAGRVLQVHALGTFQEQEVPQRLLPERQQVELHPGGEIPRPTLR